MTEEQKALLKKLKKAREEVEDRLKLSPGLSVNSATLEELARMDREEALPSLERVLKKWQMETVGGHLREILRSS